MFYPTLSYNILNLLYILIYRWGLNLPYIWYSIRSYKCTRTENNDIIVGGRIKKRVGSRRGVRGVSAGHYEK